MNKKPHYFYRVAESTEVGQHIKTYMEQCHDAEETARQWAENQGADAYYESPNGMAGGIAAVEFDKTLSKTGWERMETPDGHAFFVPQEGSKVETEMYALPIVSEFALIPILSFKQKENDKGLPIPFTFGDSTPILFLHQGYWYMDMPYECEAEGLNIITEKKFYRSRLAAVNEK